VALVTHRLPLSSGALGAIILTLGAVVAIGVGLAAIFGWSNTVVSTLVPLTVMVHDNGHTRIHTFEIYGAGTTRRPHSNITHGALANKISYRPTHRMFATAVGFRLRWPSRRYARSAKWECGPHAALIVAWIGCFTLFPALPILVQNTLALRRGPRRKALWPASSTSCFRQPGRYRWPLILGAIGLMLCGAAALFGIPGKIAGRFALENGCTHLRQSQRTGCPGHPRRFPGIQRPRCGSICG